MKAYMIFEIEVTDAATFEEYRQKAAAVIEKHGGKYIVRGGKTEALEGGWNPKRVVVLEFPSLAQAQQWYGSADYAPLIALRQKGSRAKAILVEGTA
jgi:uncharacterized protein (DUF1330 family)